MSKRDAWEALPPSPQRLFFEKVNELWWERDAPSGRAIAAALSRRGAHISQGTANNLLNGPRIPRWDTVSLVVVRLLGGDRQAFLALWRDAKRAQDAGDSTQTPPREGSSRSAFVLRSENMPGFTEAALVFELRSLLRGRPDHQSLLLDADGERLSLREAQWLVANAINELPSEWVSAARALFGLGGPHGSGPRLPLVLRRRRAADVMMVSERTVRRREADIVSALAEILAHQINAG